MKMKNILLIVTNILLYSCSNIMGQQSNKFMTYNDSVNIYTERFLQDRDTLSAIKAIGYCDTLQDLQFSQIELFSIMQKKCQLLGLIGKYREAFLLQGKAVELLDENDIRRLAYLGLKYKYEGDETLSSAYFNRAIKICDKELSGKQKIIKKVELLILSGQKREAEHMLKTYLKNHDDTDIKMMLDNFQLLYDEINCVTLMLMSEY